MDILIAAIGHSFAWQAGLTARSIREAMPGARITLFSDHRVSSGGFAHQQRVRMSADDLRHIKRIKLQKLVAIRDFPSDEFLFVDSDAYLAGDLSPLLSAASQFDFALAQDTWRQYGNNNIIPQFNTGIIFVRRTDEVQRLLALWAERYMSDPAVPDQYVFNQLFAADMGIRKHVLSPEMNVRCGEPVHLSGKGMIFHKHHSVRWNRNLAAIAAFVNSRTDNRIWLPDRNVMYVMDRDGGTEAVEFTEAEYGEIAAEFMKEPVVVEPY